MKSIVSACALAALLSAHVPVAAAATYSRSQCLTFVKQMKAAKVGKPLPNADNADKLRFKINFCLMEGTLAPSDVGNLLD